MNNYVKTEKKRYHYFLLAALTMVSSSCAATSRLGIAEISESNGLPCFSVPLDAETKNGLPLHALVVKEIKSADRGQTLQGELWHFAAADPTSPTQLRPEKCIRYGEAPAGTVQRTLKPLQSFHPYAVAVAARPENSNVIAYSAEFCIKSDSAGKIAIQVISPDKRSGDKRYDVCARPR